MRRMGDLLAATHPGRVFVLPMPRSSGTAVAETLASDLRRLDEWFARRRDRARTAADGAAPAETPPRRTRRRGRRRPRWTTPRPRVREECS